MLLTTFKITVNNSFVPKFLFLLLTANLVSAGGTPNRGISNQKDAGLLFRSIHQIQMQERHPDLLPEGGLQPTRIVCTERDSQITITGFMPYWMGNAWQDLPLDQISNVAWFALELSPQGSISAAHGWPDGPMVDFLHTGGVETLLTATLFGSDGLRTLLSSLTYRQIARDNLVNQMRVGDADGLMIDFELLPSDQYWTFLDFMETLRQDLDDAGAADGRAYQLAVATPAVDWNGSYGYSSLSDVCDFLFIMAYDYHWSGSSSTGPVSPASGWGTYNVTWTIADYLQYNGNRPQKLVLGLPWYGYDWPTVSDEAGAATTGSSFARTYSNARLFADSHGFQRDTQTATPWTPYIDTEDWRQCWHEDTLSLGAKLDLVELNSLQGIGMWALGYNGEWNDVWYQLEHRYGNIQSPQVTVCRDGYQLILEWEPVPHALGYRVYQSNDPLFEIANSDLLLSTTATSLVTNVNGSARFFKVTALR